MVTISELFASSDAHNTPSPSVLGEGADQALMSKLAGEGRSGEGQLLMGSRRQREEAAKLRMEAVEQLWRITEELNVLYKDNWTALADTQLQSFQRRILKAARGGKEVI